MWFGTVVPLLLVKPFVLAAALRLVLLAYGAWQDAYLEVKYTDLDYSVFTDGAELVAAGRCPYERPTYRYTPLLALLLTPNIWLHGSFGKLVFSGADLAVGALLQAILLRRRVPPRLALRCACVWLFNPLVLNVSTRGNFESLIALLVLGSLLALLSKRLHLAAGLLAASAHLKPFTVIYLPAFLVCIDAEFAGGAGLAAEPPALPAARRAAPRAPLLPRRCERARGALCAAFSRRRLGFGMGFCAWSGALGGVSYAWCGEPFVREALLYHLTRADAKHNFSPYFYALYLAPQDGLLRRGLSLAAFAPQLLLLGLLAVSFGRDLPFCLFVQTLLFVSLNKVCTAQYFVWYHALLPLVLPSSAILLRPHRVATACCAAAWIASLALWLGWAHQLEFRGRQCFLAVWAASLLFLAANVAVARHAIRLHSPAPLFRAGRLARQQCVYGLAST